MSMCKVERSRLFKGGGREERRKGRGGSERKEKGEERRLSCSEQQREREGSRIENRARDMQNQDARRKGIDSE